MVDASGLTFRAMTLDEVETLVGWAADEGWNPGLHDAGIFWLTDPDAFIAASLEGQLIGGGAITSYGGSFGFMGLFIVRPELRHQGLGSRLWHARKRLLLERLRPGASVGMDGVFEMQEWYARNGFVFSHREIRFEGTGAPAQPDRGIVPLDRPGAEPAAAPAPTSTSSSLGIHRGPAIRGSARIISVTTTWRRWQQP